MDDTRVIALNPKQSQQWPHPDDAVPLGAVPLLQLAAAIVEA
jgi:hypothetical protein